jgi:hypothetical protein
MFWRGSSQIEALVPGMSSIVRVGGIYVWTSRADADRVYTPEWKKFVESKYGVPPEIEYLCSPVMVDNREGTISVAAGGLGTLDISEEVAAAARSALIGFGETSAGRLFAFCPLLALGGHHTSRMECPLSGVKRGLCNR